MVPGLRRRGARRVPRPRRRRAVRAAAGRGAPVASAGGPSPLRSGCATATRCACWARASASSGADDRRSLQVQHLALDRPADPPALVVPAARRTSRPSAADELVRPVGLPTAAAVPGRPKPAPPWRPPLRAALVPLGLVLAAGFLFAARVGRGAGGAGAGAPVRARPAAPRLGPHAAAPARPATRVGAERAGYRPLEAPLAVTGDARQVARFVLERLPGRARHRDDTRAAACASSWTARSAGRRPLPPLEVPAGRARGGPARRGLHALHARA